MDIKEVTEKVNRLSEELEKLRPLKPEDEQRVMQKFRLDWNYNSNNIEGNSLTYGETKALLLFGITAQGKSLKDHLEIEGHNEAIDKIISVARNQEPLTEVFIRNLHKIILHEPYEIEAITADGKPTKKWIEIGKYKTTPNHVKTVTGEMFYFTSPEDTPAKMEELMTWYRENLENKKIHPLMFAVEFHHRFIRIHPFDDGNGRVVRLLMNLLLMQKGLPPVIVKAKDKEEYYSVLHLADSGNLEPFYIFAGAQLIHSLEIIVNAAKGEEIDELDDVDKEIALLRVELDNIGKTELKRSKTKENFERVLKNSIQTLMEICFSELSKINYMFKTNNIYITVDHAQIFSDTMQNIPGSLSDKFMKLDKMFNQLDIYFIWKDFNNPAVNRFDYNVSIKCFFSQYYYFVEETVSKKIINKKYYEDLEKEELKIFVKSILKSSIKLIKERVNKEKKPGI